MIIQGMPLVPGQARGALATDMQGDLSGSILLLAYPDIQRLMNLQGALPSGLIVRGAARFAHALIRLFTLNIPTVLLSDEQVGALMPRVVLALDGGTGWVGDEPLPAPLPFAESGGAWQTADGEAIELMASISDAQGAARAVEHGASAIGLVRSEFLHPEPPVAPDRDFYVDAFRRIIEAARPLSVTVRLFDFGPDKPVPWWPQAPISPLGLQGSRLYALEPLSSVLDAELDALDILAETESLSVLAPYLTQPGELRALKKRLAQRKHLADRRLGAMVETPAAAFSLPEWRAEADFIGIGCNDLMQAFFAADRNRPELSGVLDPYAPAWLRFLARLAEEGRTLGLPMQVCGQLPAFPGMLPLLLGMGFRAFSIEPAQIPLMGRVARNTDMGAARELISRACQASSSDEVRALLELAD